MRKGWWRQTQSKENLRLWTRHSLPAHPAVPNAARPLLSHSAKLPDLGKQEGTKYLTRVQCPDSAQQEMNQSENPMLKGKALAHGTVHLIEQQ